MRLCWGVMLILAGTAGRAEIRDVIKSAEIDAMLARSSLRDRALHEMPNYAVWLKAHSAKPGPYELHRGADDILWIRRGSATVLLGGELTGGKEVNPGDFVGESITAGRRHEVGAGDILHIPRNTPHHVDPGTGRVEYLVVRIFPSGENLPARTGAFSRRQLTDVLKKSEIDATFAKFDSNQPIHSARNYTMNYVIYTGHSGPWEAHRRCVDIYFLQIGTATAQLGGEITNPKEESPGEIRGTAVSGARSHAIGPGDIVLIPRNMAHHMDPGSGKLGYVLLKIWAD